jgi:hypothetical protein
MPNQSRPRFVGSGITVVVVEIVTLLLLFALQRVFTR